MKRKKELDENTEDSPQALQDEAEESSNPNIVYMGATLTGSSSLVAQKVYPLTKGKKYSGGK